MARLCPHPINNGTSHEAQQWILKKQIDEENLIHDKDAIVICDRGAVDTVAYYYRFCQRTNALDQIVPWEEMMVNHTPSYDLLFKTQKLPIPAVEDGQRDTDEGFREEIDVILENLLNKHSIPYTDLPATIDYNQHISFINNYLVSHFRNLSQFAH